MKMIFFCCAMILLFHVSNGRTICINAVAGNDTNSGSTDAPLKTLRAAIQKINAYSGNEPLTVRLAPGLYSQDENLTIPYNRYFTPSNRLTIEAAVMPDDSAWSPESMPTILSASLSQDLGGEPCTWIFRIETDHVTIRGIKFLGNPSLTTKHFCICRPGDTLVDLKVSQCMFLGDQDALPVQVGVITNGHNAEIEHCIFSNCRWAAIFFYAENWKVPIKGGSMHHCIVTGTNVYNGEWRQDNSLGEGKYHFIEKNIVRNVPITLVKWNERFEARVDRNFLHPLNCGPVYDMHAGLFLR